MQSPSGCLVKYIICNFIAVVKPFIDISALKGDFELVLSNCVYIHCQPIFQSFP